MDNEKLSEITFTRKYKRKIIKWAIIIGTIIMLLLMLFYIGYSQAKERYEETINELRAEVNTLTDPTAKYTIATKEVSIDLIKSEIKNIGVLASIEYFYTNAGKFEDLNKLFGVNVPFTTKSFIAKWDGEIKAGIKLDKIIVEVKDANKEIIIHMPKSEIISHEIDNESTETLDEKDGLFNPVKVDDIRNFDKISKEEMEARAIENGLLIKASENAKYIIKKLINTDVVQEQGYAINFKTIE